MGYYEAAYGDQISRSSSSKASRSSSQNNSNKNGHASRRSSSPILPSLNQRTISTSAANNRSAALRHATSNDSASDYPKTNSGVVIAPRRGYTRRLMGPWDHIGNLAKAAIPRNPSQKVVFMMPGGSAINAVTNLAGDYTDDDSITAAGWKYEKKPEDLPPGATDPTGYNDEKSIAGRQDLMSKDRYPTTFLSALNPNGAAVGGVGTKGAHTIENTRKTPKSKEVENYLLYLRSGAYSPETYYKLLQRRTGIRVQQRPESKKQLNPTTLLSNLAPRQRYGR